MTYLMLFFTLNPLFINIDLKILWVLHFSMWFSLSWRCACVLSLRRRWCIASNTCKIVLKWKTVFSWTNSLSSYYGEFCIFVFFIFISKMMCQNAIWAFYSLSCFLLHSASWWWRTYDVLRNFQAGDMLFDSIRFIFP